MKATDLKCNQRVKTMEPSEDDLKMKKESLKVELLKTYGKYIEEKCDEAFTVTCYYLLLLFVPCCPLLILAVTCCSLLLLVTLLSLAETC